MQRLISGSDESNASEASRRYAFSSPKVGSNSGAIQSTFSLARLLEHIEHSGRPINAHQYQMVGRGLKEALSQPFPDVALAALLDTFLQLPNFTRA